ncbi:MAG: response regulator [Cyanobacteriota bacterium]|nr:response regulator [Cyanobacteriota bacterium]
MPPKRLLIIDDEPDIWEMTQITLEALANWQVVGAGSGAEGIQIAEVLQPDAILLDVMMPGMDGPTTFSKLRANPATQGIPVILLTAKVQKSDQAIFAQVGVNGVIGKPFDAVTLADQIRAILNW